MSKRKLIFITLAAVVGVEIGIIGLLAKNIYGKKNALGVSTINLNGENLIRVASQELEYFYDSEPNTVPDWVEDDVRISINTRGFNERFDYEERKDPNTIRILTMGDSFTYGVMVNTADNWPESLEDLLNSKCSSATKYEVINLGMHGYDIRYGVERLTNKGLQYDPDLILWLIFDHNFYSMKDLELRRLEEIRAMTGKPTNTVEEMLGVRREIKEGVGVENLMKYHLEAVDGLRSKFSRNMVFFSVKYNLNWDVKRDLANFVAERENIYLFDYITAIGEDESLQDGHFNAKGYKRVAESIYENLKKNKIITCDQP